MGPIWPSYFNDCSSVIVCSYRVYCMHLQHLTLTVRVFLTFFVCVYTVHGGLSQHCSDIFVLCPAAVSTLCWASAQCLRAYSAQQEVTYQSYQPRPLHSLVMPAWVIVSTFNTIYSHFYNSFFFPLFFRDMPCTMSLIEIKSLFRMDDIIAAATQPITILEVSALSGQGLQEVLSWLESITVTWTTIHLFPTEWCNSHRTLNNDFKPFGERCQYPQCAKTCSRTISKRIYWCI